MKPQTRKTYFPIVFCTSLIVLSLACRSGTQTTESHSPTPAPVIWTQPVGFDFSEQVPTSPKGDTSARRHLFLHEYVMPSNGFVTGVIYLNDSDKAVELFDLLLLHPNDAGWEVMSRTNFSDDTPAAQTGTTQVNLPSPLAVQKGDIFAHWQDNPNGAIPLSIDDQAVDGFSVGQAGFQPSDVEVGQQIGVDGFNGHRDYFINVIFSTNP